MDLAKMLAVLDLVEPLRREGNNEERPFRIWKQTRTGLLSYPPRKLEAMAHLAASVYLQMALRPHILHVVGYTEADHAATAEEVVHSCRLAQRSIENALRGQPDMTSDPKIDERRKHLVQESKLTLEAIKSLAGTEIEDPFTDPENLCRAVQVGILDAPQLKNNKFAQGTMRTGIFAGACEAVDGKGYPLAEAQRMANITIREDK
jgi:hypothetical protein